jgi:hypothetical protein
VQGARYPGFDHFVEGVATDNDGKEPRNRSQNSEGGDARKGKEKPAAKAGWQGDLRPNLSQPDRFARSS